jgi:hypothetical protein
VNLNVIKVVILGVSLLMGLAGCGSSDSSPAPAAPAAPTATGKFVDAPVEGLKYVSGAQSGFTGLNGEFTYEIGQPVTFSVGGVVIGEAQGDSVITPIDLIRTANPGTTVTASTPAVVQIAQFLLTASSLTSTGIKIDSEVTAACETQNINLSTAPSLSITSAISQIAISAGNRTVTSEADAETHIVSSMDALSSGALVLPPPAVTGGFTTQNPSVFSMEWLSGKTFYQVWFGNGEDSNGNSISNVPVVLKVVFGSDGIMQATGLLNSANGSGAYGVTEAGLLYVGGSTIDGNTIVAGSTSEYIKTEYSVNGVFDNVDLYFFDQATAMAYADNLTASIPR